MNIGHAKTLSVCATAAVCLSGCGNGRTDAPLKQSSNVRPATTAAPTQGNPKAEAALAANRQLKPVFVAFCHHLNRSLEGTSRLDVATADGVVWGSMKPNEGVDLPPEILAEVLAATEEAYANKPGTFQVATVGGQKRTFTFKPGDIIEEQGNGFSTWTIVASGKESTFNGGRARQ